MDYPVAERNTFLWVFVVLSKYRLQRQNEIYGGRDVALEYAAPDRKRVRVETFAISPACLRHRVRCPIYGTEHAPRLD